MNPLQSLGVDATSNEQVVYDIYHQCVELLKLIGDLVVFTLLWRFNNRMCLWSSPSGAPPTGDGVQFPIGINERLDSGISLFLIIWCSSRLIIWPGDGRLF